MNEHRFSPLERRTREESPNPQRDAIQEVIEERIRQEEKWGTQNHGPADWMMILMEEVGEFSQAVLNHRTAGKPAQYIKDELIQFTAVALSMLECCNRNSWHKGLDQGEGQ